MTRDNALEDYHAPRKHTFAEFRAHFHRHADECGPITRTFDGSPTKRLSTFYCSPNEKLWGMWGFLVGWCKSSWKVLSENNFLWAFQDSSQNIPPSVEKSIVRRTDDMIWIFDQSRFLSFRAARLMWALYLIKLATILISSFLSAMGGRNDFVNGLF